MMRIPSRAPICCVAIVLLCAWLVARGGLRFSFARSLPRGIYREVHEWIDRGRIALVCFPGRVTAQALERGYLRRGSCASGVEPVGKIVVALPGDLIGIDDQGVQVNGELLAETQPQLTDSGGRPMPRLSLDPAPLAPGQVIVIAPHPRSLDSRYFGSISTSQIVAVVHPWMTW
jgi:conjugative transfer signal peptidase TraF